MLFEMPAQWPVTGHAWAVDYLQKGLLHGRTRHAYLFTGPTGIGKHRVASAFAQALNCRAEAVTSRPCGVCRSCKLMQSGNHPDLIYAEHDANSGQIKIDAVRDVAKQLALKPFDSRYRIAIFRDFDAAQPRAQDALLKTLEEPAPQAVLLLLAQSTEVLLPTITSRCQLVRLRPVAIATIEAALQAQNLGADQARLLARLSNGRIEWALNAAQQPDALDERAEHLVLLKDAIYGTRRVRFDVAEGASNLFKSDKPGLRGLLETWQTYWRDVLLLASGSDVPISNVDLQAELSGIANRLDAAAAASAVRATRRMMQTLNTNANLRLALEVMLLDYPWLS